MTSTHHISEQVPRFLEETFRNGTGRSLETQRFFRALRGERERERGRWALPKKRKQEKEDGFETTPSRFQRLTTTPTTWIIKADNFRCNLPRFLLPFLSKDGSFFPGKMLEEMGEGSDDRGGDGYGSTRDSRTKPSCVACRL